MRNYQDEIERRAVQIMLEVLNREDSNLYLNDSVPRAILAALEEQGLRLAQVDD
jgi:hypothetical protein